MKNKLIIGVVLYFILNILVTYLVSSPILNPNIIPFNIKILNELSAIIGNIAILLLIIVFGLFFLKKRKSFYKYLITVTFLLNFLIVLFGYYARSYKVMLSFYNLSLFRNPNAGFAFQIVLDGINELLNSALILSFVPTIVLIITYFIFRKKLRGNINLKLKRKVLLMLVSMILSISTVIYFRYDFKKNWNFRSESAGYGVMTCGLYNYYVAELVIGIDYTENYYNQIKDKEDKLYLYDKNISNSNVLDGMNLFVIQAEALQNFVIPFEYNNELLMPSLNSFIRDENVFYFNNVHTVVGLGNTSDAEFAVNTGYYPIGDLTIFWEANDKLFDIQTLPKIFGDDYISYSFNPTIEGFYSHKYVHENWLGFDLFTGFETYNFVYPYEQNKDKYLHKMWVSDEAMLDYSLDKAKDVLANDKNFYIFAQTISPHFPYADLESVYRLPHKKNSFPNVSKKFENYLNQINYNDKIITEFLLKAKEELPDTVFIIYGDHSNMLSKTEFEKLYNRKMTELEYRKFMLEIAVIIYDPSGKINDYLNTNLLDINYLTSRTLSQVDIFSTIKSLYNLEASYTLGVDMFSEESSFVIDPKALDVVTDEFIYNLKNGQYDLKDISYEQMIEIVDEIKKFKLENDSHLTKKICS